MQTQRGFTLLEIAIALMILGLALSGILPSLAARVEQSERQKTEETLQEIKEAIIGFAVINKRLPRPAKSFNDGLEIDQCNPVGSCSGFIPWDTLAVPKLDAWGKIYRYSVSPLFTDANTLSLQTPGTFTIQTRTNNDALINLTTSIPAVIFSQGKDNWGTRDDGTQFLDSDKNNTDEDTNNNLKTDTFVSSSSIVIDSTDYSGGEFDDIVFWISPNVLKSRLVKVGKLP